LYDVINKTLVFVIKLLLLKDFYMCFEGVLSMLRQKLNFIY